MEVMWAPWRMRFIENLKDESSCLFCRLVDVVDRDEEEFVLYRARYNYIVMNRYPYNVGHLMIVPYKHTADLLELEDEALTEILRLAGRAVSVIADVLGAEGFNSGFNFGSVAGAGIKNHLHLHLVPRWCGDTNFLPVLGETKSLPEYLSDTYKRLKPRFGTW